MATRSLFTPLPEGSTLIPVPSDYIKTDYIKLYSRDHTAGLAQVEFEGTELVLGTHYVWHDTGNLELLQPADGDTDYLLQRETPTDPIVTQQPGIFSSNKANLAVQQALDGVEEVKDYARGVEDRISFLADQAGDGVVLAALQAQVTSLQAQVTTLQGPLAPVNRYSPRPRRWFSPSGMNNPLAVAFDCDGQDYAYSGDIHELNDWANFETGITVLYMHAKDGLDSNPGTTEGSPWKSIDKVVSSAPDKSIIYNLYPFIDYNAALAGSYNFGTRRIKIVNMTPMRAIWNSWRLNYNLAHLAWTADGNAYKTTASINGATIRNMMDGKYRDLDGLPWPFIYVTSSALVKLTPGSWWWDVATGTLWVHMPDHRVPDPLDGWIPITSYSGGIFRTDGALTLEGFEFAFHSGGANLPTFRVQPHTTGVAAVAKVALYDIMAYGGDGNAIENYDILTSTYKKVRGGYAGRDILNHTSFRSSGTAAEDCTLYEDDCVGRYAGYDKTRDLGTLSNSNNLSTGHRGRHLFRRGTRGDNIPNSTIADVHGCFSFNSQLNLPEATKDGGMFLNTYWNQQLGTEGSDGAKMVLIGCGGNAIKAGRSVFSNIADDNINPSSGIIELADWLGPTTASRTIGTILKDHETGLLL